MKETIEFMTSPKFVLIGLFLIIFPLAYHTEQLFFRLNPSSDELDTWMHFVYSLPFAIAFEWAVIIFTLNEFHGSRHLPKLYAASSFIINVLYYDPGIEWRTLAIIFVSAILSFTVYSYSEIFVDLIEKIKDEKSPVSQKHTTDLPSQKATLSDQVRIIMEDIESMKIMQDAARQSGEDQKAKQYGDRIYRRKKKLESMGIDYDVAMLE